jgi:quercetin dioxygenase-like cupin family protein
MAIPHAKSGEVIDIRPLGSALAQARTTTLVKTKTLEVIRLVIPSGKDIPVHQAHGEITVQCLEGRVVFTAGNTNQELQAGQLLYLSSETPHALHGIENTSILLTILLHQGD